MNDGGQAVLQHHPVMLDEVLEALQINAEGVYVDCTFGRGGHSRGILQRLGPRGRLIALDSDPQAVCYAQQTIQDSRFSIVHCQFATLDEVMTRFDVARVDGILMDLGVSSPQLDDAQRGFSFRYDGPLDMRIDYHSGFTAAQWLAQAPLQELVAVLVTYGEEPFAKRIAKAIVAARKQQPIVSTLQLAHIVSAVLPRSHTGKHPATKTFQAIRIYINRELEQLRAVLPQVVRRLVARGRWVVISFHSLEDRCVKQFMRMASQADYWPKRLPLRQAEIGQALLQLVGRMRRPSAAEIAANPRARSAMLRVAERTHTPVNVKALCCD